MSHRRPHTCGASGPYDAHCTDDPGHRYSCYDAGEDVSWNERHEWLSPHACDDPECVDQGYQPEGDDR